LKSAHNGEAIPRIHERGKTELFVGSWIFQVLLHQFPLRLLETVVQLVEPLLHHRLHVPEGGVDYRRTLMHAKLVGRRMSGERDERIRRGGRAFIDAR
jgi:hypothetical protein